jgi:hypothetical protein
MSKLLQKLTKFFHTPTALEEFVISKRPTNVAEAEFWIKHYNSTKFGGLV